MNLARRIFAKVVAPVVSLLLWWATRQLDGGDVDPADIYPPPEPDDGFNVPPTGPAGERQGGGARLDR